MSLTPHISRRRAPLAALLGVAGALALASSAQAATTFDVNPVTGKDTNSGTATAPFKTLGRALTVAASGDTVRLAGGTYSKTANGDLFDRSVAGGVTVKGPATGTPAVLAKTTIGQELRMRGGGALDHLTLKGFGFDVRATTGSQTLRSMTFEGGGLRLAGTANTTAIATTFKTVDANTVDVGDTARFTMDGGAILGDGSAGLGNCDLNASGIGATEFAKVTLRNKALLQNLAGGAVVLNEDASATATDIVVRHNVTSGCDVHAAFDVAGGASLSITRGNLSSNGNGQGGARAIDTRSTEPVTVKDSRIEVFREGGVRGVVGPVTLSNTQLRFNGVGVTAEPSVALTISDSLLESNRVGIHGGALNLHGTKVIGSRSNSIIVNAPLVNMGGFGLAGNNTILGDDPSIPALVVDAGVPSAAISAEFNTWRPNTQGANLEGRYQGGGILDGLDAGAVGGNFALPRGLSYFISL